MIKAYGIAHATLTVSDVQKTKKFYENLFGVEIVSDNKYSFSLLKAGIPCWFVQWPENKDKKDRFNEKRIGLDHIAFELKTTDELEDVLERLNKMKVKTRGIEFFVDKYPYICFRDPDNIQVEFFISKP
jgi:catechol 2,3-dioxygenase-like lactoylglutathione lyase family enzyme